MDWEHRGWTITLSDEAGRLNGMFSVGKDNDRRYHHSLADAKSDVDDRVAVAAKARHADLAMPVIDDQGIAHTIRGLNRGSGLLLGAPDTAEIYYPTSAIEALLIERHDLNARVTRITAVLRPVRIGGLHSGRITAEDYDARIQELKDKYATAMVAAEDIVDPPVVTGDAQ